MLVEIDRETNELILNLSDDDKKWEARLLEELQLEFAYEPVNSLTLEQINGFAKNWLNNHKGH